MAQSLLHLLEIAEGLEKRGVQLQSLTEPIDTLPLLWAGRTFYLLCGVFPWADALQHWREPEGRDCGIEETRETPWRPLKLTAAQIAHAREMIHSGGETRAMVAELF